MGVEIERKFLVRNESWRTVDSGVAIRQGYLSTTPLATVRVRIAGEASYLTVKGLASGLARPEFEYDIPLAEAEQLLQLCLASIIEKTRFVVNIDELVWEIDVFSGDNKGLITAECELESETQEISRPDWLGPEVSEDRRYANSNLAVKP